MSLLFLLPGLDQDQQTYQPLSGMAWEEVWSCCHLCEWSTTSGRAQEWAEYYQSLLDWWPHYKAVEEGIVFVS